MKEEKMAIVWVRKWASASGSLVGCTLHPTKEAALSTKSRTRVRDGLYYKPFGEPYEARVDYTAPDGDSDLAPWLDHAPAELTQEEKARRAVKHETVDVETDVSIHPGRALLEPVAEDVRRQLLALTPRAALLDPAFSELSRERKELPNLETGDSETWLLVTVRHKATGTLWQASVNPLAPSALENPVRWHQVAEFKYRNGVRYARLYRSEEARRYKLRSREALATERAEKEALVFDNIMSGVLSDIDFANEAAETQLEIDARWDSRIVVRLTGALESAGYAVESRDGKLVVRWGL